MLVPSFISKLFPKLDTKASANKSTSNKTLQLDTELLKNKLDEGWRQGTILSVESSKLLKEHNVDQSECVLVIITQTCDLLYHSLELEPTADLLYGEIRKGPLPKRAGKSFREYELALDDQNEDKHLYVTARPRLEVCRHKLFDLGKKHEFQPIARSSAWFSRWLGEKYSRPAFPNAFDRKLSEKKRKDKIADAVKNLKSCTGLYLGLSSWGELPTSETYQVSVVILLQYEASDEDQDKAQTAHTKICKIFEAAGHKINYEASAVELDDEVSIRDFYPLRKWSLDYISIRDPDHEEPPTVE